MAMERNFHFGLFLLTVSLNLVTGLPFSDDITEDGMPESESQQITLVNDDEGLDFNVNTDIGDYINPDLFLEEKRGFVLVGRKKQGKKRRQQRLAKYQYDENSSEGSGSEAEKYNLHMLLKDLGKTVRRRAIKRSPLCMRRCMSQGFLHPAQCHSLC
ncbi:uncharacterized protein LOC136031152 [Artemia franciscana]|uniref:Uncharacterized protein n=1 Tax=Artemia franciscana TaxID=6661 RepID=A0AA88H5M9_ARTSF|nr:hypothetical protein QYM36_017331 [Artemia franciscana]